MNKFRQLNGRNPRFSLFPTDIDLDADVEGRQVRWSRIMQAACCFQPIKTVYPLKMFRDGPGLIGLYRTDKMPDQRRIIDQIDFFQRFLDVIFSELQLSASDGRPYVCNRPELAYGQQRNRTRGPAILSLNLLDFLS